MSVYAYIYIYICIIYLSADLTGSACSSTLVLLISNISYSHSQNLTISYSHILYLIADRGRLRAGRLLSPPPGSSKAVLMLLMAYLFTILTILTCEIHIICSFAHTNAYMELSKAIWSYLELSGATRSYRG